MSNARTPGRLLPPSTVPMRTVAPSSAALVASSSESRVLPIPGSPGRSRRLPRPAETSKARTMASSSLSRSTKSRYESARGLPSDPLSERSGGPCPKRAPAYPAFPRQRCACPVDILGNRHIPRSLRPQRLSSNVGFPCPSSLLYRGRQRRQSDEGLHPQGHTYSWPGPTRSRTPRSPTRSETETVRQKGGLILAGAPRSSFWTPRSAWR